MLPGLSTTTNPRCTSWCSTRTGVAVTGGSCLSHAPLRSARRAPQTERDWDAPMYDVPGKPPRSARPLRGADAGRDTHCSRSPFRTTASGPTARPFSVTSPASSATRCPPPIRPPVSTRPPHTRTTGEGGDARSTPRCDRGTRPRARRARRARASAASRASRTRASTAGRARGRGRACCASPCRMGRIRGRGRIGGRRRRRRGAARGGRGAARRGWRAWAAGAAGGGGAGAGAGGPALQKKGSPGWWWESKRTSRTEPRRANRPRDFSARRAARNEGVQQNVDLCIGHRCIGTWERCDRTTGGGGIQYYYYFPFVFLFPKEICE